MAFHAGGVACSRSGDLSLGGLEDAAILKNGCRMISPDTQSA
jgi:hypothetical protein